MPWRWPWTGKDSADASMREIRAALEFNRLNENGEGTDYIDRSGFIPLESEGFGKNRSERAIPAAYAAINLITDQLSILPRRVVNSDEQEINTAINSLLKFPSRIVDPLQFWQILIRMYVAHGNAFAYIRRNFVTKDPIELVPAYCSRARFVNARRAPYTEYTLHLLGSDTSSGGAYGFNQQVTATPRDVIALHGPGFNGLLSPSPIGYVALSTVRVMEEVNRHHRQLFKEGVNSGIALTVSRAVSDTYQMETYEKIKGLVSEQYKNSRSGGSIPFLPPGIELSRVQALSAQDLQLVELLRYGIEDIGRVFNVSPIRLGHYHEGMRARTFEDQAEDFERYTIVPHARKIDSQLTVKLLSSEDILSGNQVMTDTNELARGSMSERIRASEMATARGGFMTINEARSTIGLRPVADGDRLLDPKGAPEQTGSRENTGDPDES